MSAGDDTAPPAEPLYEQLAAAQHDIWSHWMRYLLDRKTEPVLSEPTGRLIRAADAAHWRRQIETPYAELSEREKASDREQVDRFWPLLAAAGPRAGDTAPDDEATVGHIRLANLRVMAHIKYPTKMQPETIAALLAEYDRLRSENAELRDAERLRGLATARAEEWHRRGLDLRAAGDALVGEVKAMLLGPVPDPGDWWGRLAPKVEAWRSVRGDAPTPGLALSERSVRRHQEALRDGQARVRFGENGVEIVPDRAAPAVARTAGQPPANDVEQLMACQAVGREIAAEARAATEAGESQPRIGFRVLQEWSDRIANARRAAPADDTAAPDRQALASTILDGFAERSTQTSWLALAELAADAVIRAGLVAGGSSPASTDGGETRG